MKFVFVVVSRSPEWCCISEYGENIMETCRNMALPANTTSVANSSQCR